MKMSKLAFLCCAMAAFSYAGMTITVGGSKKKHHEPPPPPRGELHERLCDRDNCCNLDVDGRDLHYTFRCDYRYERAELYVDTGRRRDVVELYDRGRLPFEIDRRDRLDLRLSYPPPPPRYDDRPRHREKGGKKTIIISK